MSRFECKKEKGLKPSRPKERDRGCTRTLRREVDDAEDEGSRQDLVRNGLLEFPYIGIEFECIELDSLDSPMVGIETLVLWVVLRVDPVLETSQAHFWVLLITN